MTTPKIIQYPMAYLKPYSPVHIDETKSGDLHYCLGCDQEMITKKGKVRRHHFAHKAPFTHCDSDNALHETGKANICRGFLQAADSGQQYNLGFPCNDCGTSIKGNIAEAGTSIASERSVVSGTRSDLVATKPNGVDPRVIIEIVVHHDLEPETKQKYEDSHIPVVKIAPRWETVSNLLIEAEGYQALNMPKPRCPKCREKEESRRKTEAKKKTETDQILAGISPRDTTGQHLTPITQDRYGSWLRAETKLQIMVNAKRLTKLGFQQQNSRPTLFSFQVGQRRIFADLDSTEVMRIWEVGCEPAIYSFPEEGGPGCRECILEGVGRIFDENAIPYRRHFEDYGYHDHGWEEEYPRASSSP